MYPSIIVRLINYDGYDVNKLYFYDNTEEKFDLFEEQLHTKVINEIETTLTNL